MKSSSDACSTFVYLLVAATPTLKHTHIMWVNVGFSITYPKTFSQHLMSKNTQDECDPPSLLKKKVVTINLNRTVTILGINPQYGRVPKLWGTPIIH